MPPSHSQSPPAVAILPLLADADNRRLLTEWLESQYEIVTPEPDSIHEAAFDLCIVDDQALADHQQALAARKDREAPGFLPYLLVTRREETETIPPEVQASVDEILTVPTTNAELTWRLDNLVRRHSLSAELKRLKEQSDERFELLFQAIPDPAIVISSEGVILNVNAAFVSQFGFDESTLNQVEFSDLEFSFDDSPDGLNPEQGTHTLYWGQTDGDTLVMELNFRSVALNDDRVEWIGVFRDFTKSKKRLDELEQEQNRLKGLHWSRR